MAAVAEDAEPLRRSAQLRQAFLQAVVSRRQVKRGDAEAILAALREVAAPDAPAPRLDDVVEATNAELARVGLEVRSCNDERSAAPYYVLVNTKADIFAELATPYTPLELAYIKAVIEAIFTAPDAQFSVSSTHALRLAAQLQPTPMTKRAASELLRSLELRGWLAHSRSTGRLFLTLRTLKELDTYLRSEFENQVLQCIVCYELVTAGARCATDGCRAAVHDACRVRSEDVTACPECNAPWAPLPVGEARPESSDGELADP